MFEEFYFFITKNYSYNKLSINLSLINKKLKNLIFYKEKYQSEKKYIEKRKINYEKYMKIIKENNLEKINKKINEESKIIYEKISNAGLLSEDLINFIKQVEINVTSHSEMAKQICVNSF